MCLGDIAGLADREMTYRTNIQMLGNGRLLAECGPMRLVIEAWRGPVFQRESCIRAAREAFHFLERIARQRPRLSCRYQEAPRSMDDFSALKMIRSVMAVDRELTPMAAVAGTIADLTASVLFSRDMTRVIVNNGGDIAIRLAPGESVKVGVRSDVAQSTLVDILSIGDGRRSWGVATSGLGGRSLTRGVASAATVIAGSASVADAAATSIANASYIADRTVIQRPAEQLDAQTDIPGIMVTIQAGPFTEAKKNLALAGAMQKTEALLRKGLICGAYIVVDGKVMMTDFMRHRLA